ncbi:hypothetical protein LP420_02790 [Massilia sp. B-10]|nr:hypothetical protein LP420_02790 [Massilia sp. B-10]
MHTSPIALALTAALAASAQAQELVRLYLQVVFDFRQRHAASSPRAPFGGDDMAAWTLAARTSLSGGVLQFGYASQVRDGLPSRTPADDRLCLAIVAAHALVCRHGPAARLQQRPLVRDRGQKRLVSAP